MGVRAISIRHRHPVNRVLIDEAPLGARLAERITGFIGSWRFVVFQTFLMSIWVLLNLGFISGFIPFDPYPFILLNLAFSTQAAYAAPLILLASNRSAQHDRLVLEHIAQKSLEEDARFLELRDGHAQLMTRLADLEALLLASSAGGFAPDGEGSN